MRVLCVCVRVRCRGCVQVRSGAAYFPYLCLDKVLAVENNAYESSLSKFCECLHQSLEEGGVVGPRGGVGLGVLALSCSSYPINLGSCGGQGLSGMAVCILKGCARVADGDGHEFHLSPYRFEDGDEWGVFGSILL